jgi:ribonuclease E
MPNTEMLINYVPGEESRIAIVEDGRLEELYQERASSESHVGNIYKGRVTNVEPAIQAAFVDFGLERNGFLHISDLHPRYFPGKDREEFERVGDKTPRRERPPIQKCLRRGQEVLVQVLKEGIGTKGPTLTSYLSIPGRFIVMMPSMERMGVSRKVDDDEARRAMRDILNALNPPEGFGFIIRTAGIGRNKTEIKRDLAYLQRLWKSIETRMKQTSRVGELYTESDLVIRTIRDVLTSDVSRIIVDDPTAAKRAKDFLSIAMPRTNTKVVLYQDAVPLFHRFDIERQIDLINARSVPLPSGGSLVIDSTEAMVAIDINSGKSRDARDAETNAYQTDMEAVEEIARQLRLRDLGGVIVLDLIDMRSPKHRKDVEQKFRNLLKKDRARTRVGMISQFGLLEMTRQRMRPSLQKSIYIECPHCVGAGYVKSPESVVLEVMRRLALVLNDQRVVRAELTISPDVAFQVLNRKRAQLVALEQRHDKPVMVRVKGDGPIDFIHLVGVDGRGSFLEYDMLATLGKSKANDEQLFVEVTSDMVFADDEEGEMEDAPAHEGIDEGESDERPALDEEAGDGPLDAEQAGASGEALPGDGPKRKRRRRRRRRGRGDQAEAAPVEGEASPPAEPTEPDAEAEEMVPEGDEKPMGAAAAAINGEGNGGEDGGRRRRRRRRRGRGRGGQNGTGQVQQGDEAAPPPPLQGQPSSGYANRVVPQTHEKSAGDAPTP